MRRRALLTTVAGTASTVALSGCSAILADSDDESDPGPLLADAVRAPYDRYVAAEVYEAGDDRGDPGYSGMTMDATAAPESDDGASLPGTGDDADPVVGLGTAVAGVLQFSISLTAARVGLGGVIEEGIELEQLHLGSAPVLVGDVDEGLVISELETAGFERSEPYRALEVYASTDGFERVAFDDERMFLGIMNEGSGTDAADGSDSPAVSSARPVIEATAEAASGDRQLASEAAEPYDDLVTALPERDCTAGFYNPDGGLFEGGTDDDDDEADDGTTQVGPDADEIDLEGDATGFATAFDFTTGPEGRATYYLAIRYADAGEVDDESAIREEIAPTAVESDVTIGGPLVVVSGTYEEQSDSES